MKKIICFLLTILGIFIIYTTFNNNVINYVSMSDILIKKDNDYDNIIKLELKGKHRLNDFNNIFNRNTIVELTEDIKANRTIWEDGKEYYIKKVLRESDILVINIGMKELSNNYSKYYINKNYQYFDKMYNDISKLIIEIKKYAKGTIIFIGYYNPFEYYDSKTDEFFYNLNLKLNRLMINNKIIYIDMYQRIKGNNFKINANQIYLNSRGNIELSQIIKFYL